MTIKLKPYDELKEISYYDGYAFWFSKEEKAKRYRPGNIDLNKRFRVIDNYDENVEEYLPGELICNDGMMGIHLEEYSDKEFKYIFGWAGEIVTKETHPEYFL